MTFAAYSKRGGRFRAARAAARRRDLDLARGQMKRLWCVRAGNLAQADHVFLGRSQIAISSTEVDDASKLPPARAAFKEAFASSGQMERPEAIPVFAGQLFRFVHEMKIGDQVVYPRKTDRTLRFGEIVGPYVYETEASEEYAHRRAIKWNGRLSRDSFSQGALYELGSVMTLFEVKTYADEIFQNSYGRMPRARQFPRAGTKPRRALSGISSNRRRTSFPSASRPISRGFPSSISLRRCSAPWATAPA